MQTQTTMKAIINPAMQDELQDLIGIDELRELVREASLEFWEIAQTLRTVVHDKDWPQVRSLSHKLKGLIGSLGYERLYFNLHELEKQLLERPPRPPLEAQIAQLFQDMDDTESAMKNFLK